MNLATPGIHHVTAIATDPQVNVDFYTGVLGLRLVKKTVNFDDPASYHLYFGDETGSPGTIITFFAWPNGRRGNRGSGQVATTSFSVPPESLGYWADRLDRLGVERKRPYGDKQLKHRQSRDQRGLLVQRFRGVPALRVARKFRTHARGQPCGISCSRCPKTVAADFSRIIQRRFCLVATGASGIRLTGNDISLTDQLDQLSDRHQ